jgi:hypothetical protein
MLKNVSNENWFAFTGIFLNSVDMSAEEGENHISTVEKTTMKPLLAENRNEMLDDSSEA